MKNGRWQEFTNDDRQEMHRDRDDDADYLPLSEEAEIAARKASAERVEAMYRQARLTKRERDVFGVSRQRA